MPNEGGATRSGPQRIQRVTRVGGAPRLLSAVHLTPTVGARGVLLSEVMIFLYIFLY